MTPLMSPVAYGPGVFSPGLNLGGTASLASLLQTGGSVLDDKQRLLDDWLVRQLPNYASLKPSQQATFNQYQIMSSQLVRNFDVRLKTDYLVELDSDLCGKKMPVSLRKTLS